jgi:aryl-alcohol dehydrogenase-like predicted oxidoreductase
VQFPFSVFDRRFEPYFSALRDMKVEMHVRSVFLQGLAFMDPAEVPRHLQDAVEKVRDLRAIAASSRASISSICLQFVLSRQEIDRVVIGVDSLENLQENLDALSAAEMTSQTLSRVDALVIHNENVTVPSNWRK